MASSDECAGYQKDVPRLYHENIRNYKEVKAGNDPESTAYLLWLPRKLAFSAVWQRKLATKP